MIAVTSAVGGPVPAEGEDAHGAARHPPGRGRGGSRKRASLAHEPMVGPPAPTAQPNFRARERTPHEARCGSDGASRAPGMIDYMLIAFSITPLGVGESVGELVADAVKVVRDSGLPNRTDAMFTTVEGEWDEVMAVLKQAVDAVSAKAPRDSVVLKADVRPDAGSGELQNKVDRVEAYLAGQ